MNDEPAFELRWQAWCVERNRRAARIVFLITAVFYPLFAILDYYVAPRGVLHLLYASRAIVTLYTFVMLALLPTRFFERNTVLLTSTFIIFLAAFIGVMVHLLGGYASPYYAGLNLIMVGAGLLFVWPPHVSVVVHSLIVSMFVFPNLPTARPSHFIAFMTSLFFLGTTATIVVAAQYFTYRQAREQLKNRLALERTSAHLASAHEELQKLDQFKSRFFANITHELKTPLAMILSPIELLIEGELGHLSEPQRATLRSVHNNGLRLLKLIGDLLDLSRMEESRFRLRLAEHDLVAYLRELIAQVEPLTSRKSIKVSFSSNTEVATAWCDLDRMERVFINLLSNAAKFTPPNGHIAVDLILKEKTITVSVSDDGPGFPSEMAERVFERFFQIDAAASQNCQNTSGTGIGLALARELVELHGGRIWAESEPGHGAHFFVEIPRERECTQRHENERRPEATTPSSPTDAVRPDWTDTITTRDDFRLMEIAQATERRIVERDVDERARGRTILIAEDTPDVVRLIHLTLRQQFRIFVATNGKKAVELALREAPHLVITDLMMPEMDGYELVRTLRANDRTKHIPIIMLTARGTVDDRVEGLESGVNAYLTKPFAPRELLATVRKLLEMQDSTAELMLTRQMDSLEIVAGGLAHEINNPLNYIKNSLARIHKDVDELLAGIASGQMTDARSKALYARMQTMFKTAESGVKRILHTVDLMRRYSREGYSRAVCDHDIFQAARDVVELVLPATGRSVKVTTRFFGDGVVRCVPEEMHQLLTNLIQNAVEAAPDDGTGYVEITGEATETEVTLSIRDNGPGVKPEDRARIFTPFFTTKAPGAGMGMGLTIAWRVVQALGGTLSEEGSPGQGACFVMRLPASLRLSCARPSLTHPAA
jgi:signal transduction histidine kinase